MDNFYQLATQQNYSVAKSYYKQRREMLNQLFRKNSKDLFKEIIKYINEKIEEYQTTVVDVVFSKLNLENGYYSYKGASLEDVSYPVLDIIEQIGNRRLNKRNISSFLGFGFEKFLENALATEELATAVSNETIGVINSLMAGFTRTGGITSTSAVVEGRKSIRPDLGLGMSMYINDSGAAQLTENNGYVELQALVDLNELVPEEEGEITSLNILQQYLSTNAFGFSAKLWKDGNNKEFSQSSVLQKMINEQLNTIGPHGNRLTWETNYTEAYVVYQLSKYLINIIGPINVAIITGGNFIWMDEFINQKIFYMTVQAEGQFEKSKRGAGYEIFPHIPDSSIKLRVLNNEMQRFRTSFSQKSRKISIVNRRIKT